MTDTYYEDALVARTSTRSAVAEKSDVWKILHAKLMSLQGPGVWPTHGATNLDLEPKLGIDWEEILDTCTERETVVALLNLTGMTEIGERISNLIRLEADFDQDEVPLRLESLKGFADFVRHEKGVAPPATITLSPDGNLSAEWHYGSNRHLAIKFLDESWTMFASIAPARSQPSRTKRLYGRVPSDEVVDSLSSISVRSWKYYGRR